MPKQEADRVTAALTEALRTTSHRASGGTSAHRDQDRATARRRGSTHSGTRNQRPTRPPGHGDQALRQQVPDRSPTSETPSPLIPRRPPRPPTPNGNHHPAGLHPDPRCATPRQNPTTKTGRPATARYLPDHRRHCATNATSEASPTGSAATAQNQTARCAATTVNTSSKAGWSSSNVICAAGGPSHPAKPGIARHATSSTAAAGTAAPTSCPGANRTTHRLREGLALSPPRRIHPEAVLRPIPHPLPYSSTTTPALRQSHCRRGLKHGYQGRIAPVREKGRPGRRGHKRASPAAAPPQAPQADGSGRGQPQDHLPDLGGHV